MQKIDFQNYPNTTTPVDADNLNDLQDNVEEAINEIVESNSNINGNYIKYVDGTMICYKTVIANVTMDTAWGSLYEGNIVLGDWAEEFIDVPNVQTTNVSTVGAIIECFQTSPTKTNAGVLSLVRVNSATFPVTINVLGIGKWK